MPGEKIRLLQVGDVHFPEAAQAAVQADLKDPAFPSALAARVGSSALQLVTRKIQAVLSSTECDAILLMGDLTSRGDKAAFAKCLRFLESAFLNKGAAPISSDRMLVVPGS
ncbi:metallophosphoesterase [Dongia deserti]|uniref:metallophosphoesterase n=1 Tax=Dongia deserti TaxID=2268030 RepID=UPI000E656BDF